MLNFVSWFGEMIFDKPKSFIFEFCRTKNKKNKK